MGLIRISETISELREHGLKVTREPVFFTFGSRKQCEEQFRLIFYEVDKTTTSYQYLPEYEKVVDWMANNLGKGLCLVGDPGRGKSTILTGILPVLFYEHYRKIIRPFQASDIPDSIRSILQKRIIMLDDVGTEIQCSEWGERYEGFNRILDNAEAEMKILLFTTNLTGEQIITRYGIRAWERINRLCSVVRFKGESLRK